MDICSKFREVVSTSTIGDHGSRLKAAKGLIQTNYVFAVAVGVNKMKTFAIVVESKYSHAWE